MSAPLALNAAAEAAPARDAATVLLLRPRADAPFEIFMVKRTGRAAFMANALVFPGGRLDAADASPAWADRCTESPAEAAARLGLPATPEGAAAAQGALVAALRETFEEAGLLLARHRDGRPLDLAEPGLAERLEAHRAAQNAGEQTFLGVIEALDLVLETHALTYLARWITPAVEARRFDTRFFAARAPAGQEGRHDARETTASAWMTPAETLAACAAGTVQLAPPTLRILMELGPLPSLDAALDVRGGRLPPTIAPRMDPAQSELTLLLPGDADYDATAEPGARNRITWRGEGWLSEGSGF